MLRYYWRWLKLAVRHSWSVVEGIAGVFGVGAPALAWLMPSIVPPAATDLSWIVPLSVLGPLVLYRLVMAPWWMHTEDTVIAKQAIDEAVAKVLLRLDENAAAAAKDGAALREQLGAIIRERDDARQEAVALVAERNATRATPEDVVDAFRQFARRGRAIVDADGPYRDDKGEAWVRDVRQLIQGALRPTYVDDFEHRARGEALTPNPKHRVMGCVKWLNEWDGRLSTREVRPDCKKAWLDLEVNEAMRHPR